MLACRRGVTSCTGSRKSLLAVHLMLLTGGRRDKPPAPCTGSGSAAWVSEATTDRRGWTKLNCKPPTKIGSGLRRAGPLQFRQADMEGWMADRTVAPYAVV